MSVCVCSVTTQHILWEIQSTILNQLYGLLVSILLLSIMLFFLYNTYLIRHGNVPALSMKSCRIFRACVARVLWRIVIWMWECSRRFTASRHAKLIDQRRWNDADWPGPVLYPTKHTMFHGCCCCCCGCCCVTGRYRCHFRTWTRSMSVLTQEMRILRARFHSFCNAAIFISVRANLWTIVYIHRCVSDQWRAWGNLYPVLAKIKYS